MLSWQVWRHAILRVAAATEESLEAQIIKLFFTQVGMVFDDNLNKVRFVCPSEFVYKAFSPYSMRFYYELKNLLGINDLGFSLEVVSSKEFLLLQENGTIPSQEALRSISLDKAPDEVVGESVFPTMSCIALENSSNNESSPMGTVRSVSQGDPCVNDSHIKSANSATQLAHNPTKAKANTNSNASKAKNTPNQGDKHVDNALSSSVKQDNNNAQAQAQAQAYACAQTHACAQTQAQAQAQDKTCAQAAQVSQAPKSGFTTSTSFNSSCSNTQSNVDKTDFTRAFIHSPKEKAIISTPEGTLVFNGSLDDKNGLGVDTLRFIKKNSNRHSPDAKTLSGVVFTNNEKFIACAKALLGVSNQVPQPYEVLEDYSLPDNANTNDESLVKASNHEDFVYFDNEQNEPDDHSSLNANEQSDHSSNLPDSEDTSLCQVDGSFYSNAVSSNNDFSVTVGGQRVFKRKKTTKSKAKSKTKAQHTNFNYFDIYSNASKDSMNHSNESGFDMDGLQLVGSYASWENDTQESEVLYGELVDQPGFPRDPFGRTMSIYELSARNMCVAEVVNSTERYAEVSELPLTNFTYGNHKVITEKMNHFQLCTLATDLSYLSNRPLSRMFVRGSTAQVLRYIGQFDFNKKLHPFVPDRRFNTGFRYGVSALLAQRSRKYPQIWAFLEDKEDCQYESFEFESFNSEEQAPVANEPTKLISGELLNDHSKVVDETDVIHIEDGDLYRIVDENEIAAREDYLRRLFAAQNAKPRRSFVYHNPCYGSLYPLETLKEYSFAGLQDKCRFVFYRRNVSKALAKQAESVVTIDNATEFVQIMPLDMSTFVFPSTSVEEAISFLQENYPKDHAILDNRLEKNRKRIKTKHAKYLAKKFNKPQDPETINYIISIIDKHEDSYNEKALIEAIAKKRAQAEAQAQAQAAAQAAAQAQEQAETQAQEQVKAQDPSCAHAQSEVQEQAQVHVQEQAETQAQEQVKAQDPSCAHAQAEVQEQAQAQVQEQVDAQDPSCAHVQAEVQEQAQVHAQEQADAQDPSCAHAQSEVQEQVQANVQEQADAQDPSCDHAQAEVQEQVQAQSEFEDTLAKEVSTQDIETSDIDEILDAVDIDSFDELQDVVEPSDSMAQTESGDNVSFEETSSDESSSNLEDKADCVASGDFANNNDVSIGSSQESIYSSLRNSKLESNTKSHEPSIFRQAVNYINRRGSTPLNEINMPDFACAVNGVVHDPWLKEGQHPMANPWEMASAEGRAFVQRINSRSLNAHNATCTSKLVGDDLASSIRVYRPNNSLFEVNNKHHLEIPVEQCTAISQALFYAHKAQEEAKNGEKSGYPYNYGKNLPKATEVVDNHKPIEVKAGEFTDFIPNKSKNAKKKASQETNVAHEVKAKDKPKLPYHELMPIIVDGMVMDINDKGIYEGHVSCDYVQETIAARTHSQDPWKAPLSLTNADGSLVSVPQEKQHTTDVGARRQAFDNKPGALSHVLDHGEQSRIYDNNFVVANESYYDEYDQDLAYAAKTYSSPAINVGSQSTDGVLALFGKDACDYLAYHAKHPNEIQERMDEALANGTSPYDVFDRPETIASKLEYIHAQEQLEKQQQEAVAQDKPAIDYDALKAQELKVSVISFHDGLGDNDELNPLWDATPHIPKFASTAPKRVYIDDLSSIDTRSLDDRLDDELFSDWSQNNKEHKIYPEIYNPNNGYFKKPRRTLTEQERQEFAKQAKENSTWFSLVQSELESLDKEISSVVSSSNDFVSEVKAEPKPMATASSLEQSNTQTQELSEAYAKPMHEPVAPVSSQEQVQAKVQAVATAYEQVNAQANTMAMQKPIQDQDPSLGFEQYSYQEIIFNTDLQLVSEPSFIQRAAFGSNADPDVRSAYDFGFEYDQELALQLAAHKDFVSEQVDFAKDESYEILYQLFADEDDLYDYREAFEFKWNIRRLNAEKLDSIDISNLIAADEFEEYLKLDRHDGLLEDEVFDDLIDYPVALCGNGREYLEVEARIISRSTNLYYIDSCNDAFSNIEGGKPWLASYESMVLCEQICCDYNRDPSEFCETVFELVPEQGQNGGFIDPQMSFEYTQEQVSQNDLYRHTMAYGYDQEQDLSANLYSLDMPYNYKVEQAQSNDLNNQNVATAQEQVQEQVQAPNSSFVDQAMPIAQEQVQAPNAGFAEQAAMPIAQEQEQVQVQAPNGGFAEQAAMPIAQEQAQAPNAGFVEQAAMPIAQEQVQAPNVGFAEQAAMSIAQEQVPAPNAGFAEQVAMPVGQEPMQAPNGGFVDQAAMPIGQEPMQVPNGGFAGQAAMPVGQEPMQAPHGGFAGQASMPVGQEQAQAPNAGFADQAMPIAQEQVQAPNAGFVGQTAMPVAQEQVQAPNGGFAGQTDMPISQEPMQAHNGGSVGQEPMQAPNGGFAGQAAMPIGQEPMQAHNGGFAGQAAMPVGQEPMQAPNGIFVGQDVIPYDPKLDAFSCYQEQMDEEEAALEQEMLDCAIYDYYEDLDIAALAHKQQQEAMNMAAPAPARAQEHIGYPANMQLPHANHNVERELMLRNESDFMAHDNSINQAQNNFNKLDSFRAPVGPNNQNRELESFERNMNAHELNMGVHGAEHFAHMPQHQVVAHNYLDQGFNEVNSPNSDPHNVLREPSLKPTSRGMDELRTAKALEVLEQERLAQLHMGDAIDNKELEQRNSKVVQNVIEQTYSKQNLKSGLSSLPLPSSFLNKVSNTYNVGEHDKVVGLNQTNNANVANGQFANGPTVLMQLAQGKPMSQCLPNNMNPSANNAFGSNNFGNNGLVSHNSNYDPTPFLEEIPLPPEMIANMSPAQRRAYEDYSDLCPSKEVNPNKTFASYIIEPTCSKLVHAIYDTCNTICTPGYKCPMFIHGPSGVGKTHLLSAMVNKVKAEHPHLKVAYVRSEDFIRQYVASIADMQKTRFSDRQVYFQQAFTDHDLLIFDDIQSLVKGEKSRKVFFDIVDDFLSKPSAQLVLAADVPVSVLTAMGFSDDLTSRINSGVTIELKTPGHCARRDIIKTKCDELGMTMCAEILEFMALNISANVRDIEGALRTIHAMMKDQNSTLTFDEVVRNINNFIVTRNNVVPLDSVLALVSAEFKVSNEEMFSPSKKKLISQARSVACCLARDFLPELSLNDLAKVFKKDHSSIHEAILRTRERLVSDYELKARVQRIVASVNKLIES